MSSRYEGRCEDMRTLNTMRHTCNSLLYLSIIVVFVYYCCICLLLLYLSIIQGT